MGAWAESADVKEAIILEEDAEVALVSRVINQGYAPDLTDGDTEKIGRDPFLIAYALASPGDRCIVTTDVSRPRRQRANRHVPDVSSDLGLRCCNTFQFVREQNFFTGWKSR